MAINNTNRQNPFMYLLESKNEELQLKTFKTMKSLIIMALIEIELFILFCLFCFVSHSCDVFMIIGMTAPFMILCAQTIEIVKFANSEASYVNEIIFSDKYKFIDLNNEQLLSKINKYNTSIGKVDTILHCNYLFILMQMVYNACFILYFISIIFK